MTALSHLQNRLAKNAQATRRWRARESIEAWRLYDEDMPEFPLIVDVFGPTAVVYDKAGDKAAERLAPLYGPDHADLRAVVAEAAGIAPEACHVKARRVTDRETQYEKLAATGATFPVREGALRFLVNVTDYLDCGLFLDQRPLRQSWAAEDWGGKSFLNLFCYTGSMSVAVAKAGGRTVSVDMSNTYLAWAEANFAANGLATAGHAFVRADVLALLAAPPREWRGAFDAIYLDPPIFSRSKKMTQDFDVQRDHAALIRAVLGFLAPGGRLTFSTPRQRFKLDPGLAAECEVRDITAQSIPPDFRNKRIHTAFSISLK